MRNPHLGQRRTVLVAVLSLVCAGLTWWLVDRDDPRPDGGRLHRAQQVALNRTDPTRSLDFESHRGASVDSQNPVDTAPAILEPFYAFVVAMAEADSLGSWNRADLEAFLGEHGQASRLPLEHLVSIQRAEIAPEDTEYRRGVTVTRRWRLVLDEALHYDLPNRVLGYQLGSVSVASQLVFSEWRLGDRNTYAPTDTGVAILPAEDVMVFRLDEGWIMMDVPAVLDKMLGGKVDDSWTQGFAICRREGAVHGLALSQNRDRRQLYSEINFATNKISLDRSPFSRGISVLVRPWVAPPATEAEPSVW